MNKISKKIVSLVTMAAFALTLVPAAAFAADDVNTTAAKASSYTVVSDEISGTAEVDFTLNSAAGTDLDTAQYDDARIYFELTGGDTSDAKVNFTGLSDWFNVPGNVSGDVAGLTRDAGLGVAQANPSVDITGLGAGDYTMTVSIDIDGYDTGAAPVKIATKTFTVLTPASAHASKIVIDGKTEVDADQYDKATVEFDLRDVNNKVDDADYLQNVKVWATDAAGNFTDAISFTTVDGKFVKCDNNGHFYKFEGTVTEDTTFEVTFERGGTYNIYAGVGNIDTGANTVAEALGAGFETFNEGNGIKVVVTPAKVTTDYITLTGPDASADNEFNLTLNNSNEVYDINLVGYAGFIANGTSLYTLSGVAHQENGDVAESQDVTFTSGDPENLQFENETGTVTVKTDRNGAFKVKFTMNDNRNVPITITVGDKKFTVRIVKEVTTAYDIDVVEDGGYILAGNDKNYAGTDFSDAVKFNITDNRNNVLSYDEIAAEPLFTGNDERFVRLTGAPEDSTLTSADLVVIPSPKVDEETYTLAYRGDSPATDLIPGQYKVRVALLCGDYVEVVFNVDKFGTAQSLELSLGSYDDTTNRNLILSDEVTLGQTVTIAAMAVDENGIKIPAYGADYGAYGKAVEDVNFGGDVNFFTTRADEISNESLLGTTIDVWAYDEARNLDANVTLTVVDSYNTFDLEFDPVEGPVKEDNDVDVTVVKEDGSKAQVNGQLMAYIEDQSNEDAVVTVDVKKNVKNGKGELTVYSTEDTDVTIRVAVKDASNQGLYVGSLDYSFGKGDINAHHNVTMTIGSTKYVVDKQLFEMDAAPYVDSNWRTMVPLRALMEGFDAEVIWDNDARTVTINNNQQTVVMTIGETTYTVNGEELTMDTEPVIQSDRTFVPIRFAAEAMGFVVNPLYDGETGLTASVVFQS